MKHERNLTARAQELRKNMTKEERRLWYEYLRKYPYRFRRQVAIGSYIVDFYCAAARIAIELDGSQHYDPRAQAYDDQRSVSLNSLGIYVLRFSNTDVLQNLRGVCCAIDMAIEQRIAQTLSCGERTSPAPVGGTLPKGEGITEKRCTYGTKEERTGTE